MVRFGYPKKAQQFNLLLKILRLYRRAIQVYEGNKWEDRDGKVFLNGKETSSYTFRMNYYWMMGDNRHSFTG